MEPRDFDELLELLEVLKRESSWEYREVLEGQVAEDLILNLEELHARAHAHHTSKGMPWTKEES